MVQFYLTQLLTSSVTDKSLTTRSEGNSQSLLFFFFPVFCLFRAAPSAYGSSQARDLTGAISASLRQSHSNARSEPRLRPTPQLMATPDP